MKRKLLLITAILLLSVSLTSCSILTENDSIVSVIEGTAYFDDYWTQMIFFEPEAEDYVFELRARDGSFFVDLDEETGPDTLLDDHVLQGTGSVCFVNTSPDRTKIWEGERTFVEALIKKGDQYLGYAVVQIDCEKIGIFQFTLLECKTATLEDAAEKGLTKEQLQAIIDELVEKNS